MSFIALVNGSEITPLELYQLAVDTINVRALDLTGAALDVTADTLSLEIYATPTRVAAALLSVALTVDAAPTSGASSVTLTNTTISTALAKGTTYFMFVKRIENVGSTVIFSRLPTTLIIR